jgi:UDP-N-acetylmuramyl tripeptide synthase
VAETTTEPAPEPNHGFDDSRRLTGANRWYAGTAVTLTPLGAAAHDSAAHVRWAARVQAACAHLGWPAPQPRVLPDAREPLLLFAAPDDALFTATEVNEWAWERSAAEAGVTGFDLAQDLGDDSAALAVFAQRAAAEQRPAQRALQTAAAGRGLPVFIDDEALSLGAGSGSRTWPLTELPAVADVPWPALHDLPTALVTGSNGKTTTVRLLAAIAAAAGVPAGYCCTEGVFVAGQAMGGGDYSGDYSGPAGARAVLRHAGVELAVLETARGGLMRRGLAVARADVAVVTNVSADHLGEYGVAGVEDIAEAKLVVARALLQGGTLVLNGGDAVLMAMAARTPHVQSLFAAGRLALFARDADCPALLALRQSGGSTCGVRDGRLLWSHGGASTDLGAVADFPLTLGGAAPHNTENIAVAVLAAQALGLPEKAIRQTLGTFGSQAQDNPGRLERWAHRGATVLIDYAHNPDGLAQLLAVARALLPTGARLGLLLGQAGNRDDAAIIDLARTAAAAQPERIVIKELPGMLRGRPLGAVPALIETTLHRAGFDAGRITLLPDEEAAARALLAWAQPGDVLVLPIHTKAVRERLAQALRAGQAADGP